MQSYRKNKTNPGRKGKTRLPTASMPSRMLDPPKKPQAMPKLPGNMNNSNSQMELSWANAKRMLRQRIPYHGGEVSRPVIDGRFQIEQGNMMSQLTSESSDPSISATRYSGPPVHQNSSMSSYESSQSTFGSAASARRTGREQQSSLTAMLAAKGLDPFSLPKATKIATEYPGHSSSAARNSVSICPRPQPIQQMLPPAGDFARRYLNEMDRPRARSNAFQTSRGSNQGLMFPRSAASLAGNSSYQGRSPTSVHFSQDNDQSTGGVQESDVTNTRRPLQPVTNRQDNSDAIREELSSVLEARQKEAARSQQEQFEKMVKSQDDKLKMLVDAGMVEVRAELLKSFSTAEAEMKDKVAADALDLDDRMRSKSSELDSKINQLALPSDSLQEDAKNTKIDFEFFVAAAKMDLEEQLESSKDAVQAESTRQIDAIKFSAASLTENIKKLADMAASALVEKCQDLVPASVKKLGSLFQRPSSDESEETGKRRRTISPVRDNFNSKARLSSEGSMSIAKGSPADAGVASGEQGCTISPVLSRPNRSSARLARKSNAVRPTNKESSADATVRNKRGRTISPPPTTDKQKSKRPLRHSKGNSKRRRTCKEFPLPDTELSQGTRSSVETAISLNAGSVERNKTTTFRPETPNGYAPLELRTVKKVVSQPMSTCSPQGDPAGTFHQNMSQDTTLSSITATQHDASATFRSSTKCPFDGQHGGEKENKTPASARVRDYSLVTPVGCSTTGESKAVDGFTASNTEFDTEKAAKDVPVDFSRAPRTWPPADKGNATTPSPELDSSQDIIFPMDEVLTGEPKCDSPLTAVSVPKPYGCKKGGCAKHNQTNTRRYSKTTTSDPIKAGRNRRKAKKNTYSKRLTAHMDVFSDELTFAFDSSQ